MDDTPRRGPGANWHSRLYVPLFSMRFSISAAVLGFSSFVSKASGAWGISLFLADSLISFPYFLLIL